MERFGQPGKSLLGADSHTPAAGSLDMLAIGAGGLDVALAMAGEFYVTETRAIFGVELNRALPAWVSSPVSDNGSVGTSQLQRSNQAALRVRQGDVEAEALRHS